MGRWPPASRFQPRLLQRPPCYASNLVYPGNSSIANQVAVHSPSTLHSLPHFLLEHEPSFHITVQHSTKLLPIKVAFQTQPTAVAIIPRQHPAPTEVPVRAHAIPPQPAVTVFEPFHRCPSPCQPINSLYNIYIPLALARPQLMK